jgi:hypothetical protein
MADEEDLSALGNAFQGLHPVLVQQEQIYREAGRAVINFSNIESDLTFLFGVLIGADLYSMAIAAIGDVKNNFALRLKLVDLLVEKECTDQEKERWRPISGTISTHKGIRNLIAHQRMGFEPIDGPEPAMSRVVLEPALFGLTRKGRKLEGHQIKATADALEPIADRVYEFARDLMLRRAPDSLKGASEINP